MPVSEFKRLATVRVASMPTVDAKSRLVEPLLVGGTYKYILQESKLCAVSDASAPNRAACLTSSPTARASAPYLNLTPPRSTTLATSTDAGPNHQITLLDETSSIDAGPNPRSTLLEQTLVASTVSGCDPVVLLPAPTLDANADVDSLAPDSASLNHVCGLRKTVRPLVLTPVTPVKRARTHGRARSPERELYDTPRKVARPNREHARALKCHSAVPVVIPVDDEATSPQCAVRMPPWCPPTKPVDGSHVFSRTDRQVPLSEGPIKAVDGVSTSLRRSAAPVRRERVFSICRANATFEASFSNRRASATFGAPHQTRG